MVNSSSTTPISAAALTLSMLSTQRSPDGPIRMPVITKLAIGGSRSRRKRNKSGNDAAMMITRSVSMGIRAFMSPPLLRFTPFLHTTP